MKKSLSKYYMWLRRFNRMKVWLFLGLCTFISLQLHNQPSNQTVMNLNMPKQEVFFNNFKISIKVQPDSDIHKHNNSDAKEVGQELPYKRIAFAHKEPNWRALAENEIVAIKYILFYKSQFTTNWGDSVFKGKIILSAQILFRIF